MTHTKRGHSDKYADVRIIERDLGRAALVSDPQRIPDYEALMDIMAEDADRIPTQELTGAYECHEELGDTNSHKG